MQRTGSGCRGGVSPKRAEDMEREQRGHPRPGLCRRKSMPRAPKPGFQGMVPTARAAAGNANAVESGSSAASSKS